ncbi:MAG TPA: hypothetical protein EYP56_01760 [Planctomycetaceae bacterium]|nr:hypothetical protein [Planctomycetaceae bacterium]
MITSPGWASRAAAEIVLSGSSALPPLSREQQAAECDEAVDLILEDALDGVGRHLHLVALL